LKNNQNQEKKLRILVTGATGFIGSRLTRRLIASGKYHIRCMTRNPDEIYQKIFGLSENIIEIVRADATKYEEVLKALEDIDVVFYLIHSMEGTSSKWKEFSYKDRLIAENFAKAASEKRVKRIIYLGGLINEINHLSDHMRSRKEVGEILKKSTAKVTVFRAAIILGAGGGSFQMLKYLVERLPIMVCPKWVQTRSQPIAVDDVVNYLVDCLEVSETEGKEFDIGGPEIVTYFELMKRYAKTINKSLRILVIPFLTPRLSSYWIDLVTPVKASLARPLIDSLKHEATVKDGQIRKLIPFDLSNIEQAIKTSKKESEIKSKILKINEKSSISLNNKILIISLLLLVAIGSTYYYLDTRQDVFRPYWIVLTCLWYFGIFSSIYFVRYGARLGSLIAGILGWITVTFWLLDNIRLVYDIAIMTSSPPDLIMTIRNFLGIVISISVILSSHNVFHKIRLYKI